MRYLAVGGWLLVTAIGGPLASDAAAGEISQLRVATFCSDATQPLGSPTTPVKVLICCGFEVYVNIVARGCFFAGGGSLEQERQGCCLANDSRRLSRPAR